MRYLMTYRPGGRKHEGMEASPDGNLKTGVEALIEEMTRAGVLLAAGKLEPDEQGAIVRRSGRRLTVVEDRSDPATSPIAGYATVQVESRDEAIEWARRFLEAAGEGESEVRRLVEFADFP